MDICAARMFLGYHCHALLDGYARLRKVLTSVIGSCKYDGQSRLFVYIFLSAPTGKQLALETKRRR